MTFNFPFVITIRSPPKFPEVALPEDIVLGVANALRVEVNKALEVLRCIASGKDLKKFLAVWTDPTFIFLHYNPLCFMVK